MISIIQLQIIITIDSHVNISLQKNQNVFGIKPVVKQINVVWTSKINPIAKGCFEFMKIKLNISKVVNQIHWIISRKRLNKILILEFSDEEILIPDVF